MDTSLFAEATGIKLEKKKKFLKVKGKKIILAGSGEFHVDEGALSLFLCEQSCLT